MMSGKHSVAIIGGSGPEAGLNVAQTMLTLHKGYQGDAYQTDKDAASIIILQDPGIGGPHGTWDMQDPNSELFLELWKNITNAIWKLHLLEVKCFCIACNTLHYLEPRIRKWMKNQKIKPTFISIIKVTKSVLLQADSKILEERVKKVAILGSFLTTDVKGLSPYAPLFKDGGNDYQPKILPEGQRKYIQSLINDTKQYGPTAELQQKLSIFLKKNFTNGTDKEVDFIALACTELPLLLDDETKMFLKDRGIFVVDPNAELAREMLRVGSYLPDKINL